MKKASLVFFYFGEKSYVNRLAQEALSLRPALEGYEHSVLLHHETSVGMFKVSDSDARWASEVDLPTKENFVKYLNQLGEQGYEVDLFIFSHGVTQKFLMSKGTYGDSEFVSSKWLSAHLTVNSLRAVWQCNCYGSTLNAMWLKFGAKVSAGSHFVNFYPTRFKSFMRAWRGGSSFGEAVRASDNARSHAPVQVYILADAAVRAEEWGGSAYHATQVLGSQKSSEAYFRECWLGDDWQSERSGRQNMNNSSTMILAGDALLFW